MVDIEGEVDAKLMALDIISPDLVVSRKRPQFFINVIIERVLKA